MYRIFVCVIMFLYKITIACDKNKVKGYSIKKFKMCKIHGM